MGNFSNNAITDVGRMLLADVQAGAVFTPTRIVMGSGSMPGGITAQGITDVITPVKSLAINKKKRTPDGKCVFGGVYTNEEVTEPFYFRELALYAKAVYLNEDGSVKSEGAETLYSYGNAGATADYMPAYSTSTVVEKQMDLVTWIGNEAQVDLSIESGLFITHGDFDSHAARHAAGGDDPITPESIGAAPAGFGLGGTSRLLTSTDNLDHNIQNGWYSWHDSMPVSAPGPWGNMIVTSQAGHYTQTVYLFLYPVCVLERARVRDEWSEWEWVNPPLLTGVEYRTTERRDKKAVYKRLDSDGVLKYRLDGETAWKTYAQEHGAAPADYGVGESAHANWSNVDNITGNGWYLFEAPTTIDGVYFQYSHMRVDAWNHENLRQTLYPVLSSNPVLRRQKYGGEWLAWEWENPPMVSGFEYRTTERYKGAAVYKKVDAAGNILWRTENETSWRVLISASNVAPASVE